jgi:hypothetical protein
MIALPAVMPPSLQKESRNEHRTPGLPRHAGQRVIFQARRVASPSTRWLIGEIIFGRLRAQRSYSRIGLLRLRRNASACRLPAAADLASQIVRSMNLRCGAALALVHRTRGTAGIWNGADRKDVRNTREHCRLERAS